MVRTAHLEIHKDELTFCAGHFTIFSATEREPLHGHNYNLSVAFDVEIGSNGLSFDYRFYKRQLKTLCDRLNSLFLLPGKSPYLTIDDAGDYLNAIFNQKIIPFLKEDAIILPITNITIEELSNWFLEHITANAGMLDEHHIHAITVKVFNGPGQSGGATWQRSLAKRLDLAAN